MPDAVLTLKINPQTGERTLTINYESDPDALSFEHEDDHRAFVEGLLGQPLSAVADRLELKREAPHELIASSALTQSAPLGAESTREGEATPEKQRG